MTTLTVNRITELIYSAWCKGETKTNIIVGLPTAPLSFTVEPAGPEELYGKKVASKFTNIRIHWSHTFSPSVLSGRFQFGIYLNGWPTGTVSVAYANSRDLLSTSALDNPESCQLMLTLVQTVACEIVENPDLAKFVEPKPIDPYVTNPGDPVSMIAEEAHKLYTQQENKFYAKKWSTKLLDEINKETKSFNEYYDGVSAELKAQQIEAKKEKFKVLYEGDSFIAVPTPSQQAPKPNAGWNGSTVQGRTLKMFPGLATDVRCPVHGCDRYCSLVKLIQHLNDSPHCWPRTAGEAKQGETNIADWLEEWSASTGISLEMRDDNVSAG